MKAPWKMPTKDQLQELIDNTIQEWTITNGVNDVNGYKFISKSDSTKYIFLPAAGRWYDAIHPDINSFGYYWSSILGNSTGQSWSMYFYSDHVTNSADYQYYGLSIRAIRPLKF